MDVRQALRAGTLKVSGDIRIDGTLVRKDGTRHTQPEIEARRKARREANKRARKARRGR